MAKRPLGKLFADMLKAKSAPEGIEIGVVQSDPIGWIVVESQEWKRFRGMIPFGSGYSADAGALEVDGNHLHLFGGYRPNSSIDFIEFLCAPINKVRARTPLTPDEF
jgi:hypothetical protein